LVADGARGGRDEGHSKYKIKGKKQIGREGDRPNAGEGERLSGHCKASNTTTNRTVSGPAGERRNWNRAGCMHTHAIRDPSS